MYEPSRTVEFRSRVQKRPGRDHSPWMQRMDRVHLRFAVAVATQQIRSSSDVLVYGKDVEGLKNSRSAVPGTFWYP